MNKFKKGQRVFYLLMGSTCQSNIVDFYTKDGIIFYVDDLFDNIKEFINFDIIIYLILVYLIYIIILRNKESYNRPYNK